MTYHFTTKYQFNIPTLPKPYYTMLTKVRRLYKLSPWQCVILALQCLSHMGAEQGERVQGLVEKLKTEFPAKYR